MLNADALALTTVRSGAPSVTRWLPAVLAALIVAFCFIKMSPTAGPDAGFAVLSAEQHVAHKGNLLEELIVVDEANLQHDLRRPITWWAPGAQQIVYGLRRLQLPLGKVVKGLAFSAWVIGLLAWAAYFSVATENKTIVPWLVAMFACFRMTHYNGFVFLGGETFLLAAFPIVALLNLAAFRAAGSSRFVVVIAAGVATALLIQLKYSAAFLVIALGVAWLWQTLATDRDWRTLLIWGTAGTVTGLGLMKAGLAASVGASTPASALCRNPVVPSVTWAFAGWPLALSDIDAAVETVKSRLGAEPDHSLVLIGSLIVTIGILAFWFFGHRTTVTDSLNAGSPTRRSARRLAVTTLLTVSTGLAILLVRGGCLTTDERHQQYTAFLALPFLADGLYASWRTGNGRVLTLACGGLLILFPTVYGAGALADKTFIRTPKLSAAETPEGTPLHWLGNGSGMPALYLKVRDLLNEPGTILATSRPQYALLFPTARLLIIGDDRPAPVSGRPDGAVVLILPAPMTTDRIGRIQSAFRNIHAWTEIPSNDTPDVSAWVGR